MLNYDRPNKPYLTEHSGHCSCCDARFAADADLYMVPGDDYAARSDMRATVPVCAQCLTPDQRERAREIGLAITCLHDHRSAGRYRGSAAAPFLHPKLAV